MNYFELYPGDYLKDTGRLTLVDHGAYLRLMLEYYATEEPLPADLAELYVIAAAVTAADRAAVKKVADRFFPISPDDGLRHNGRVDEEIEKAQARMTAARENGKRGGRPKKNPVGSEEKPSGFPLGSIPVSENETQKKALQTPHEEQEHETPTGVSSPEPLALVATGDPAAGSGDRPVVPNCPVQRIVDAYHAELPMLPRVRALPDAAERMLRTRWREDESRQTVDWWREFFGYVRGCPFLVGAKTDFTADLLWLVRPVNFAKVVNGNFEEKTA